MSYWAWDSSLNLGIDIIDAQHRHIVGFINELHEAHASKDDLLVYQTLTGLIDYTVTHFAFEEELITLANYPLAKEHRVAHESFTLRIEAYKERHAQGKDIARPLMNELKIWLTQHIKIEDKRYVPYVKKGLNRSWVENALIRFFGA